MKNSIKNVSLVLVTIALFLEVIGFMLCICLQSDISVIFMILALILLLVYLYIDKHNKEQNNKNGLIMNEKENIFNSINNILNKFSRL